MLVNMKGSMLGYGAILAVLVVGSFVILDVTKLGSEHAVVSSREGQLISFGNYGHFFVKMLDQSIYFISQRAAYELGKTGGIEGSQVALWDESYPTLTILKENLENKITQTLSSSEINNVKRVIWGESDITTIPNEPFGDSKYFFVRGTKSFSIYSKLIDSTISLDHEINSRIDSNYFKLLNAGRAIMEDPYFDDFLSDAGALLNELHRLKNGGDPRFAGLDFGKSVNVDIVEIAVREVCYPSSTYCLAPLKSGESGSIGAIPYDYVELRFRYQRQQTGDTELEFDFDLTINPNAGTLKVVCV